MSRLSRKYRRRLRAILARGGPRPGIPPIHRLFAGRTGAVHKKKPRSRQPLGLHTRIEETPPDLPRVRVWLRRDGER